DGIKVVTDLSIELRIKRCCRATTTAATTAALGFRSGSTASSRCSCTTTASARVPLVQKLVSTECVSGAVVPGTRDLSIAVGVENLSAPAHSGTLRLRFVFRLSKRLVV